MYPGEISNISQEGLLLNSKGTAKPDDQLYLIFQIPPYHHLFQLKAVVAWISTKKYPDDSRDMGIKFIDLDIEDKKHLSKCTEVLCNT
jgi:Tfp pilus assembly protein PilZ